MSNEMLTRPVELTDAELDAIAAGSPDRHEEGSLVAVGVQCLDVDVAVIAIAKSPVLTDQAPCN